MLDIINAGEGDLFASPPKLLDVVIPTYKRPKGAVLAALSVLTQLDKFRIKESVNLIVWDDCTPGLDIRQISSELVQYAGLFIIGQNKANKGMSRNICDLVEAAKSEFCSVLTDDDWFEPDSLPGVLDEIGRIKGGTSGFTEKPIGAFFVPRYSYLDDGSLLCIECAPFAHDGTITRSPNNVIKYCRNAFILTGLFFKPSLVDFCFWRSHQDNAFFPLLYYASVSIASDTRFLHAKWLHHTCDNLCHWDAWGSSKLQQNTRLHLDYLQVLILIAHKYPSLGVIDRLRHANYLRKAFLGQLYSYHGPAFTQFFIVSSLSSQSFVLVCSYLQFSLFRGFYSFRQRSICFSSRIWPSKR